MGEGQTLRAGDWVEVCSAGEVLATLDDQGCLENLPFMPEMARYCRRRFQVVKSAHKTCDPTGCTDLRRMPDAVHLDTRCDGSAHDGCEARCLLFWKTAWLKRVDGPPGNPVPVDDKSSAGDDADVDLLRQAAQTRTADGGEIRYRCQATELVGATTVLPASQMWQYVEDVTTRNVSLADFVRYSAIAVAKFVLAPPVRLIRRYRGEATPQARAKTSAPLNLQPGEMVQVRTADEITATFDREWKNRGLSFEKEMLRYCGGTYRVLCRVNRIIDEKSGKMIKLANDCIILEGLHCAGLANRSRLFCPRSPYFYWREAWLRRVGDGGVP